MDSVIGKRHNETVRRLLKGGGPDAGVGEIAEALMRASLIGNTACVRALLDRGADVNGVDRYGWTPLMEAAFGGHVETIHALLERGADVNIRDQVGSTPLMEAASKGHTGAVRLLLARGADVRARNRMGRTALQVTPKGNLEIVALLRQAGADG